MIRRFVALAAGSVIILAAVAGGAFWTTFRVYVPEDSCAVLIRKTGAELPEGQSVATDSDHKGIIEDVLGPGRYFYNPYSWNWEITPLIVIPAGDPKTWEWTHSLSEAQREALRAERFKFKGEFPMIGVVTRKVGPEPPGGGVIVTRASGYKGILREVLTPGTYKINPYVYQVEQYPAVVIPAGFVGVVTNLFGAQALASSASLDESAAAAEASAAPPDAAVAVADESDGGAPAEEVDEITSFVRPLAKPGERGTMRDVLQPGVYFINPKLQKVTLIEIGYNEYSQVKISEQENFRISFPSDTGFTIQVGVTVVWGIHPAHAADIINEFGNIDRVLDKVIGPQLRSICRNIGSTFSARDFIHGEKREMFQLELTQELQRICRGKNLEILIALVREIEVNAPTVAGGEVTADLKRTIQESYIAIEKQITKDKQRDAAAVRAELEEEQKKVEIARETVRAESRVMVANVMAEGDKQAAEIDAQAELDVATIQEEVARLDAQRTEMLGQANADVERMKNEAEAEGYELLINAFGGGQAYNLFTFAENFEPESVRLFFAGEGTFWTDLSRFEELGAAKLLRPASGKATTEGSE